MRPQLVPTQNYSREQMLWELGIKSHTTLASYCKALKIQKGLSYFTQHEHDLLLEHRRKKVRRGDIENVDFKTCA
jgi:hypothetical protein